MAVMKEKVLPKADEIYRYSRVPQDGRLQPGVRPMIRLDGRKVLVTGGSRGIGRATALLFARAGADVAISYVSNREAADEVVQEVEKLGRRALAYKAEMSSRDDIDRMVGDVLARWGELDTLVNNAGIWTYLEMGKLDDAVYHETIGVNVDGVFFAINAVVPAMKEHGRGWIINVTSTAAVRGRRSTPITRPARAPSTP